MKVKLDLQHMPDDDLSHFAKKIVVGVTNNSAVPNPNPTADALGELASNFSEALDHYTAAKAALAELCTLKDQARAALEGGLTTEGATVESQTGGEPAKIESVGMQVQAKPTRTTSLDKPEHFTVTMGDYPGTLDWYCDADEHTKNYLPYTTPAPVTAQSVWTPQMGSSGSKGSVGGFVSGSAVAVRLVKQGAHGLVSPPSDPVTRIVP